MLCRFWGKFYLWVYKCNLFFIGFFFLLILFLLDWNYIIWLKKKKWMIENFYINELLIKNKLFVLEFVRILIMGKFVYYMMVNYFLYF